MQQPEIIANNPLRVLGVYVGDSMAQEANNMSRIVAFSKVGKTAMFAMRGDDRLPPLQRTEEMAVEAQQQLTLPKDRLRYTLFWYATHEHIELNNAIDAMTEARFADAFNHYIAMITNDKQYQTFIQAATHGLLSPSKEEVLSILLQTFEKMEEMPLVLTWKKQIEEFSWYYSPTNLRSVVELTTNFLQGMRLVYESDNLHYIDYLHTAVANISNIGKHADEYFNSIDYTSLVQLNLHLEASEVAHTYIVDTINSWMLTSSISMQKMSTSLLAPYEKSHSEMLALVPQKKGKLKRNLAWRFGRTLIWLILLFLLSFYYLCS